MEVFIQAQLKALRKWKFEDGERSSEFIATIEGVQIVWDVERQYGAHFIGGVLTLIHNWEELDDLMEQIY